MSAALPLTTRLGYGVGDVAFNLFFTTANLYLLLYYTDVLALDPGTAGLIFAGALIWDAVLDPIMGYLASRTRSRWGRYRPWILFGAVPLGASWVLMFAPTSYTGNALVAVTLATHLLFRTLYTIVSMPYVSLSATMTSDSTERGILASFRMVAATGAGLCVAFLTLKLATTFGSGDQATGFFWVSVLYAVIASILLMIVFASTEEQVDVDENLPSIGELIVMLRRNRAFWLISGSLLMASIAGTFFGKSVPYYFKYALGREADIGTGLALLTASAMVSIPLWTIVMRRTSKRTVSLSGSALGVTGYAAFLYATGLPNPTVLPLMAVIGFAAGAGYLTFWAMIPDTVEYGEWHSGVRAEGLTFGLIAFVQKAALGFAVGLLGQALSTVGYVANETQSASTLGDIRLLMTIVPMVTVVCGAMFIAFYPLDGKLHGRLVAALAIRRIRVGRAR
jgi:GPH family glycoside/pentoside/hexuronide:cation symporter